MYQVRTAIPWRTTCLPPPRKTTHNVSTVADRSFTCCCESRIALNGGHRELGPASENPPGPDAATSTALDVASPTGGSTRTLERQATPHRLDLPGGDDVAPAVRARRRQRQPHIDREARQAARAPSRLRLPTLGMHRRKMSADQPLVAHDAFPTARSAAARPLSSARGRRPAAGRRHGLPWRAWPRVPQSSEAYGP